MSGWTRPPESIESKQVVELGDAPNPAALMRLIDDIIPEARQASPVMAMLLALARCELKPHLSTCGGVIIRLKN